MRAVFAFVFVATTATASANAVMGYALEEYDGHAWLVYVVATIIFEAWAIGNWAGISWPKAFGISLLANFVTAGCCANLCGVGLHAPFVGSTVNPNPLLNMLVMFLGFGLLSGLVESIVWRIFVRQRDKPVLFRTVAAHLIWVPLGMAIMLVPSRPYPMLESYTLYARRMHLHKLRTPLEAVIAEVEKIPNHQDTVRLFREFRPEKGRSSPDDWAAAYRPAYGRFSTGQSEDGEPLWEWNPAATGLDPYSDKMPNRIWLLRMNRRPGERGVGFVWEGNLRFTNDQSSLGY
jgi:hypothetical protein